MGTNEGGEAGLRSIVSNVCEQLDLDEGNCGIDVVAISTSGLGTDAGSSCKECFEATLRTLLQAYMDNAATAADDEVAEAAPMEMQLVCRFMSGEEQIIQLNPDSTTLDARKQLGKMKCL